MNTMRKWLRSFRFAYEGLVYALTTERNMKLHFAIAFVVLLLALLLGLSKLEILFIMLAITLIIMAELFNTAIEKAVDLAMPHKHPVAKIAKDVAAAAVLMTAVFAVGVGAVVFYGPVNQLLRTGFAFGNPASVGSALVFIGITLITITVIQTRFSRRNLRVRPSLIAALSFSISTLMVLYAPDLIVGLLACSLSLLILLILYEKTERSFVSLLFGGCIGSIVTISVFFLVQSVQG